MGIICPNISHPDYKKLVELYGEDKAILMFVDNSYQIPNATNSSNTVKRVMGRLSFPFKSTMALLRENPAFASEMIDELNDKFPEVRIVKEKILDKDGKYIEFQPGEKGMHYRNAFESVVAWANDASIETPPHEYAHHYIEMFHNSAIVQEAIKKYGGIEPLAEMMGRHYAKKKMSSGFVNWAKNFWNTVKKYFGNSDVGYELADAFYNAKKLDGKTGAGLATVNYQKGGEVREFHDGGYDMKKQKFGVLPSTQNLTKDDREALYQAKARETFVKRAGINIGNFNNDQPALSAKKMSDQIDSFREFHQLHSAGKSTYNNSVIDNRYLKALNDWLYEGDNMTRLAQSMFDPNADLITDTIEGYGVKVVDLLGQMQVTTDYKRKMDSSITDGKGNFYSLEDAVDKARKEVVDSQKKRDQMYDKYIKYAPLKKMVKKVEKLLLFQLNGRLISKYISGSSSSFLSDSFYKSLNHAEDNRNFIMMEFNKALMQDKYSAEYKKWSYFKNKKAYEFENIDSLDTETHTFKDKEGKPRNIKLTKAEMLSIHLMGRQKRAADSMFKNGIILNDTIEGRDVVANDKFQITKSLAAEIDAKILNDPAMVKAIEGIDKAMKYMEGHISETYSAETGLPFEVQKNYFPTYAGTKKFEARKSKSSSNDFRSLNASLGNTDAIRIVDPIQVINSYKVAAATYSALAIPIANNKKVISQIESQFKGTKEEPYIEAMKAIINQLEDRSTLYSGQGEQEWEQTINKLTSNFTVAVLGMNIPVMAKQSVSFLTAMEAISGKYLKKAGFGSKMYPVINPLAIFKALDISNPMKGNSILPVEWNLDTSSGTFALMREHSPALAARLDGMVTREMAEALMNQDQNDDIITIPGFKKKDGTHYKVSKTRLMEGIRIFDAVTIENLWRAAEFEAVEEYGLKRGTEKFYKHVAIRTQEIVSETQPNNNITDKSTAANLSNPLARFVTQFSSATSKIAMQQIDGVLDYLANPTSANLQRILKRSANIMISTALTITIMDALRTALLHGYEDDDELMKDILISGTVNSLSYYYGVGLLVRGVGSQLDDKPFYQSLQTPVEAMGQDLIQVLSNLAKGNLAQAATKGIELTMKTKGFSANPLISARALYKKNSDD